MYNTAVINVDELWLKGKNRPLYFRAITRHLRELLAALHPHEFTCKREQQRLVAQSDVPFPLDLLQALANVPGVHSVFPARRVPVSLDALLPVIDEELSKLTPPPATFKVETRRSYKGFPLTSMEVSAEIGAQVLKRHPGLKVNVKTPGLVIEIRILEKNIYLSTHKIPGAGGLPVGTSGHVVSLISGGFDSPVASYLMSRRGCRQTFIFFYAYPFVGEEVKNKILELMKVLGRYQRHCRLYIAAFGDIQQIISKRCKEDYRTLLFRKAMLRCAELLARKVKAEALLTGDALGQVSSQTIGNIAVLDKFSSLPIFRPLLGFNKVEIIDLAKKIGTHDISVIPHDDACSLFAPRHPIIRPRESYLEQFHREVTMDEQLQRCLEEAEIYDISLTGELTARSPSLPGTP
jgi:thiamine biosynthesis protein ThiI